VTVLQEALEEEKAKASSSSGWFGSGAKAELAKVQQQFAILKEELEVKIRENEELHMRIFETGQETGTIKEDLQERISKLKSEVRTKTDLLEDLTQTSKANIARLTSENTTLQGRSEELSDTLMRTKSLMQQREHSMTHIQQQLTSERDAALAIISTKLPFNDTSHPDKNRLNLPVHDRSKENQRSSIVASAITLFKKFIGFWKEWCDAEQEKMLYLNRSSADTPEDHRQINRKTGTFLAEFPDSLSHLTTAFSSFMRAEPQSEQSETCMEALKRAFESFLTLHEKATLAFKARLESENNCFKMFTNNESARSYNTTLIENWAKLHSQLEKLGSYMAVFCGATGSQRDASSPSTGNALFSLHNMLSALGDVKTLLKERASTTSSLCNLELQHDAFMSNDIKVVNNRRATSLSNASAMLEKIFELSGEYVASLGFSSSFLVKGASVDLPEGLFPLESLKARSVRYMRNLQSSSTGSGNHHTSIPYEDQLRHLKEVTELSQLLKQKELDIASLTQQITQQSAISDRAIHELRGTKDALVAKQKALTDSLAEVADLKTKLAEASSLSTPTHSTESTSETQLTILEPSSIISTASLDGLAMLDPTIVVPSSGDGLSSPPPSYSTFEGPAQGPSTAFSPPSYTDFLTNQPPSSTTEASVLGDFGSTSSFPILSSAALASTDLSSMLSSTTVISTVVDSLGVQAAQSSNGPASPVSTPLGSSSSKRPWSMTVVEDPSVSMSLEIGDEEKEREEQLKRFYEQRVQQFQAKIDATDKKNVELYQQTLDLERRIKETVAQREALRADLDAAGKRALVGNDELETTRANYDSQLKMLTEHMVSLSDKIAMYEEQLSTLKNSTVRCGKCKAWNSIEWLMGEGKMGQRCSHGNHPSSFNYA
jgi:hypothetical protein